MPSYTLPGGKIPVDGGMSPTLLFHKWHAYDSFLGAGAFEREICARPFLQQVSAAVQQANLERYGQRHSLFHRACEELGAAPPLTFLTEWRLIVGWATNPALEVGLTLDPLYGYPFIPGSAVKGLLHHVAETELMKVVQGEPAIPAAPAVLPDEPPSELGASLRRAGRVWGLFGSLNLERNRNQPTQPEAPRDRLAGWLEELREAWGRPEDVPPAWQPVKEALRRLCEEPATGGVVICMDAVPAQGTFSAGHDSVLATDVLTPQWHNKPNPLVFLAVRQDVKFEFRYRVREWSSDLCTDEPGSARAEALGELGAEGLRADLKRWLGKGLEQLGAGGKTSAGYGYLRQSPPGVPTLLEEPRLPGPYDNLPPDERTARLELPEDGNPSRAVATLDKALKERPPHLRALVLWFRELYPGKEEEWAASLRSSAKNRAADMAKARGQEEGT